MRADGVKGTDMSLTGRERRQLSEIDRRLASEEPRLHRALARLSLRPLHAAISPALLVGSRRIRLVLVLLLQASGIAALVVGEIAGIIALLAAGAVVATFGPLLACRMLRRRWPPLRAPRPRRRRPRGTAPVRDWRRSGTGRSASGFPYYRPDAGRKPPSDDAADNG